MKDKSQMKVEQKLDYFDYAATSPMRSEALETYRYVATHHFGNTQSLHDVGTGAADILRTCKTFWGELYGQSEGIYFTGSASEGNQLAIRSHIKGKKGTILCNPLEHASILTVMGELQQEGIVVKWIPLTPTGQIDLQRFETLLIEDVLLVIVQWVNSETGIIQPVSEVIERCKARSLPVHCDAVQGFGKLAFPAWMRDTASSVVSSHKISGPKGCGMTWMNPRYHWLPLYVGTTHQQGFRAGTLDVPAIAAMTAAAELAIKEQPQFILKAISWEKCVRKQLPDDLVIVGEQAERSPFIVGLIGWERDGQYTMLEANRSQFAFSTGSACKIGHGEAMSTLTSLGYPEDVARQFVRISFGRETTDEAVQRLTDWLHRFVVKIVELKVNGR